MHDFIADWLNKVAEATIPIVASFIVQWILARIEALRLGKLQVMAGIVVQALEQTLTQEDRIKSGKAVATAQLKKLCPSAKPELVDIAIEAAVHQVNMDNKNKKAPVCVPETEAAPIVPAV